MSRLVLSIMLMVLAWALLRASIHLPNQANPPVCLPGSVKTARSDPQMPSFA
jgi:hypothetical protein